MADRKMTLQKRAEQYRDRTFGPYGAPPTREAGLNGFMAGAKWQRRADKVTLAQLAVVRAAKAWASPEGSTVQGRVRTEPALYSALTFLEHMETEGKK